MLFRLSFKNKPLEFLVMKIEQLPKAAILAHASPGSEVTEVVNNCNRLSKQDQNNLIEFLSLL